MLDYENSRTYGVGGYFRLSVYDFHAMYAAHTMPMADMSATISDKISYNDNHASPPFAVAFGGFWVTAYRYGSASFKV